MCQPPKLQRLLRWDPLAPHQEEAVNADAAHGWGRRFWSPQPQHSLQGSADLIRLIAIENRNLMISMKERGTCSGRSRGDCVLLSPIPSSQLSGPSRMATTVPEPGGLTHQSWVWTGSWPGSLDPRLRWCFPPC